MASVTVRKWVPVCYWGMGEDQNICGICRNLLTLPCISCEANPSDNKCRVCIGFCNHAFHQHCLTQYFNKGQSKCPFDSIEFNVAKVVEN